MYPLKQKETMEWNWLSMYFSYEEKLNIFSSSTNNLTEKINYFFSVATLQPLRWLKSKRQAVINVIKMWRNKKFYGIKTGKQFNNPFGKKFGSSQKC